MLSRPRLMSLVGLVLLSLSLGAAEGRRVFPLWDGKEAVVSYAERVKLPRFGTTTRLKPGAASSVSV